MPIHQSEKGVVLLLLMFASVILESSAFFHRILINPPPSRHRHHLQSYYIRKTFLRNENQERDFGFKAATKKEIIPIQVVAPDTEEINLRKLDEPMFTTAVRRDLYNILRNPYQPNEGAPAPLSWWGGDSDVENSQFGAILLARNDEYAFTDRLAFEKTESETLGFSILDDQRILDAIAKMGQTTPESIAITKAFEAWLTQTAKNWGDTEVSKLSVDFLIAFGNEITERLGVNHRILSTALSDDEVEVLSREIFIKHVKPELVQQFQTKREVDIDKSDVTMWWDHEDDVEM